MNIWVIEFRPMITGAYWLIYPKAHKKEYSRAPDVEGAFTFLVPSEAKSKVDRLNVSKTHQFRVVEYVRKEEQL